MGFAIRVTRQYPKHRKEECSHSLQECGDGRLCEEPGGVWVANQKNDNAVKLMHFLDDLRIKSVLND